MKELPYPVRYSAKELGNVLPRIAPQIILTSLEKALFLSRNCRDLRVRFLNLSKFPLFAAALLLLCFQPGVIQAEDEQGTATAEETESEPAQETPGFIPGETPAPAPNPAATTTAAATPADQSAEGGLFGIGKFSRLPFHLLVSARGGYDDNVTTSGALGNASAFIGPSGEINYKFGDPRTTVNLKFNAGIVYYLDRSLGPTPTPPPFATPAPTPSLQDYDSNISLGLTLLHKASARLTLGAVAYLAYQTEPDFSANVGTNRRSGNYLHTTDKIHADYQWKPRFSTSTSYDLFLVRYDESAFSAFLDRSEHILGNQFLFLLWPQTTLVAEVRLQIVTYDQGSSTFSRSDSTTELLLGGVQHKFSPRFGISLRGGVELRSFESGGERTEPYFESSLNYALGERTTLGWTNRYSLEEPGVVGSRSLSTYRTGLQARHGFTSRISGTIGAYYVHDDYAEGPRPPPIVTPFGTFRPPAAPAFTEDTLDITLQVRFEINRTFSADVGYSHTEVTSDQALRDYSRNRFYGGINFSF